MGGWKSIEATTERVALQICLLNEPLSTWIKHVSIVQHVYVEKDIVAKPANLLDMRLGPALQARDPLSKCQGDLVHFGITRTSFHSSTMKPKSKGSEQVVRRVDALAKPRLAEV